MSRSKLELCCPGTAVRKAEEAAFLQAMRETTQLLHQAQAQVQRARSQCHAETYEYADLMSRRLFELKLLSEWLQLDENTRPPLGNTDQRQGPVDRRQGIDRRLDNMRRQLFYSPESRTRDTAGACTAQRVRK